MWKKFYIFFIINRVLTFLSDTFSKTGDEIMKKILLVEDDIQLQESVKEYLEYKKFLVITASDGREAKDCLLTMSFDLIISDIQMKNCNGIELLEWSKKERPISFIFMTGYSQLLETASAFDLGADNFLEKPFSSVELLKVIEKALNPQVLEVKNLKGFYLR